MYGRLVRDLDADRRNAVPTPTMLCDVYPCNALPNAFMCSSCVYAHLYKCTVRLTRQPLDSSLLPVFKILRL
jgi:hypothetical protein